MATPRIESGRVLNHTAKNTPHLIHREPNLLSSSSSPMIATPAKIPERPPQLKWEASQMGHLDTDASGTSVASTSSQDSLMSSRTSVQHLCSPPRSTSPMPKMPPLLDEAGHYHQRQQGQFDDVGLGFGANVKFGFQQHAPVPVGAASPASAGSSGVRMVPATPPPPGSTTPGSGSTKGVMERFLTGDHRRDASDGLAQAAHMAAEEARAQSEAEEAAAILVNSVATTPRHHGRHQSLSKFPPMDTGDDDHIRSTPAGEHTDGSPAPTLPSFLSSSPPPPPSSSNATISRDPMGYRGVLPTTSPSHLQSQYSAPPSSAHSASELSQASNASASKPKKKSSSRMAKPGEGDPNAKPPYSYAGLIGQAILSQSDKKLSLNDIYVYIMTNYPFYKKEDAGWQNSIRHNLSLNECFVKKARDSSNPGKGCLWSILDGTEDQFEGGNFVKRSAMGKKKNQATSSAGGAAKPMSSSLDSEREQSTEATELTPASVAKRPTARRGTDASVSTTTSSGVKARSSTKRRLSREPSEDVSVHSGQDPMSEEGENADAFMSEEEAMNTSEEMLLPESRSSRKRQRLTPSAGLPLPAYPPRNVAFTSPAAHHRGHSHSNRATRTSPPPFMSRGPLSPPTAIMRRMSNPWPIAPPKPNLHADAIMSSPGAGGIMQPPRYYPGGRDGPGYLEAAPLIRPGHRRQTSSARDVQGEEEGQQVPAAADVTMSPRSLNTQSPVSSLRSAFQPPTSPVQAKTSSLRGGGRDGDEGPLMSPPPPRSRELNKTEEDKLLRTPPSSSRGSVFSTPRRAHGDMSGHFSTPAGWSSSQYDPYDHGGAVMAEVERVGRKGVPPTPKFSTPGMNAMTPW